MARKPNAITEYLTEAISYGGTPTRRIDIMRAKEAAGLSEQEINHAMFLLDQAHDVAQGRCVQTGPCAWRYLGNER